ncbi:MAG: hypothetical protein KME07_22040 [Pegethrix bostrychoides GSE-TBD4-15B]|jgi:hypothetical protein|uniref:Uncharacterized protein n=1 Tax=Pegethrix bostrychoides GSE-TBD4-15B TaxID=2839662 RepID=A0A951PEB7_9CYAN|nr:hypothetical protein [Pegethrix bostrychoides GSE-TBD4-15B]
MLLYQQFNLSNFSWPYFSWPCSRSVSSDRPSVQAQQSAQALNAQRHQLQAHYWLERRMFG